ncbi:MAG: HNH endonuclease signature motif containing protein [Methanothrix sp.]|nr:HNH endonuclease signature motif containing protein [Methanothrix sp.]
MPEINCDNCGKIIKRKKSKVERAKKHYCSKVCRYHAQCKAKRLPMIIDGHIHLEVTKGKTTIFDIDDSDLAEYNWQSQKGYISRKNNDGKYIYMHRVILERKLGIVLTNKDEPDHINGNRSDNRRSNLRLSTHLENWVACQF